MQFDKCLGEWSEDRMYEVTTGNPRREHPKTLAKYKDTYQIRYSSDYLLKNMPMTTIEYTQVISIPMDSREELNDFHQVCAAEWMNYNSSDVFRQYQSLSGMDFLGKEILCRQLEKVMHKECVTCSQCDASIENSKATRESMPIEIKTEYRHKFKGTFKCVAARDNQPCPIEGRINDYGDITNMERLCTVSDETKEKLRELNIQTIEGGDW